MIDEKALYIALGSNIRTERKEAKLNQKELADILGLERTSISNIEKGKQKPPIHIIYTLSVVFGKNLSTLLPSLDDIRINEDEILTFDSFSEKAPRKTAELIKKLI